MTSGGLAIDLGENMTKVTSTGIAAGYRTPFVTYFYRSWFCEIQVGVEISPPRVTARPARRRATARVNVSIYKA